MRYHDVIVDGEDVHVVERDALSSLPIDLLDVLAKWFRGTSQFVRRHPELSLAWHIVPPRNMKLWIVLLETASGPQRVELPYVTCKSCGWYGCIASPIREELYWGSPDPKKALDRAWNQPTVPCPKCSEKLPLHAIWAEIDPAA
jgi:hypothetical protein